MLSTKICGGGGQIRAGKSYQEVVNLKRHTLEHIRHQAWRHRRRAFQAWKRIFGEDSKTSWGREYWTPDQIQQWVSRQTDRKRCSCWMCGNPRKHWGTLPIRDRRLLSMEINEDVELAELLADSELADIPCSQNQVPAT